MAPNKFRKETEFTFLGRDGETFKINARPTLARLSKIEGNFGAVAKLLGRFSAGDVSVRELTLLVGMMVEGDPAAPTPKELPEMIFDMGASTFLAPCVEFLINAVTAPEAAPATEGNAA